MSEKEDGLIDETLEGWINTNLKEWTDHYNTNYRQRHEEYWRIFRGQWNPEDKNRSSERSRLISPASQQAVESATAEVEEASFGRGQWFRMDDDDQEPEDVKKMEKLLGDEFKITKMRTAVSECVLGAAVVGTGIIETVVNERSTEEIGTQTDEETGVVSVGTTTKTAIEVKGIPVPRNNFIIDPAATTIEDALGVAVVRYVSTHTIEQDIEAGIFEDVDLEETSANESDILPDASISYGSSSGFTKLTKYYGLVPRHLLEKAEEDADVIRLAAPADEDEDSYYVEAVVVLAGEAGILKAESNPFMMVDRPVKAFCWDNVPGVFDGRGIVEKAYNSQKGLDSELRGRTDALGFTVHPMMGLDANKMPRGTKLSVSPGKQILTNGPPSEALHPFNFGNVDQITFQQAAEFQKMVQTATGAVDSAGVAGQMNGEGTAAGVSMSLGAIVKRHKRTLLNFQENFIIPLVECCAYRYMQYNPELFPVGDYSFKVTATLGIVAREYEVTQMVQLLQTLGQDSPIYPVLVEAVVENMNLSNRDELLKAIKASQQPNPAEEQRLQEAHAAEQALQAAQTHTYEAQALEFEARTRKYDAETAAIPKDSTTRRLDVVSDMRANDDGDFDKKMKVMTAWKDEQRALKADKRADIQLQLQARGK